MCKALYAHAAWGKKRLFCSPGLWAGRHFPPPLLSLRCIVYDTTEPAWLGGRKTGVTPS